MKPLDILRRNRILKCSAIITISSILYTSQFCYRNFNKRIVRFDRNPLMEGFIPPFINYTSHYAVAERYGIAACQMGKSMSQWLTNMVCLIYNEEQFNANNQSMDNTWMDPQPCMFQGVFQYLPYRYFTKSEERILFTFIRDPFLRFVSLYMDKCVKENACFDCKDDMRCVVRRLHSALRQETKKDTMFPFLREEVQYMLIHSVPASWNCNFRDHFEAFEIVPVGTGRIERSETLAKVADIFRRRNVPDRIIERIVVESMFAETKHSTYTSAATEKALEQVRTDPYVRDYLHKIYLFDYLVFGLDRSQLDPQYQHHFWNYDPVTEY